MFKLYIFLRLCARLSAPCQNYTAPWGPRVMGSVYYILCKFKFFKGHTYLLYFFSLMLWDSQHLDNWVCLLLLHFPLLVSSLLLFPLMAFLPYPFLCLTVL